jgi:two-component system phosphate regulon response regulator OmpR
MAEDAPRVVIVEDDDDTRSFLVDLFVSEGYAVRAAGDPEGAYAAIRDFDPMLAVLDVMLPRESGFDIYRAVMKEREHLPAIFVTAKPSDLPRLHARVLGAVGFFRKPFDAEDLLAAARAAITGPRTPSEAA